ncbi:hypothetical protein HMP06_0842 [Sphingomonas sp. HMP6]|nr:hypothetical protein HMP06_0842 [Sphingomonas sp. HMP6]
MVLVVLNAAFAPFVALTVTLVPEWFTLHVTPVAAIGDACLIVIRILTMIAFGRWIYVAGSNLVVVGTEDLDFTPGARIWWFAVPLANCFKPYQGMRELWNASRRSWPHNQDHPLLAARWACWLLDAGVGYASRIAAESAEAAIPMLYANAVVSTALAATAIAVVLGIARGQSALGQDDLSTVFA